MAMLLESWQTKNYFAYTVELKLRDGEVYGIVPTYTPPIFEGTLPEEMEIQREDITEA